MIEPTAVLAQDKPEQTQMSKSKCVNANTTAFCHWDFELYLAFELCHLIFLGFRIWTVIASEGENRIDLFSRAYLW